MPTKFEAFAALHVPGDPVILYNIWDVGSAQAVIRAGAKALATGSHPAADANGWPDGEGVPIDFALANAKRIADSTELPLSVDFESAYSDDPDQGADNVVRLAGTGAIGCNFVLGGEGLYPLTLQAQRIEAIRRAVGDQFSSTPAPTCTSRRRRMTRRWSTKRSSAEGLRRRRRQRVLHPSPRRSAADRADRQGSAAAAEPDRLPGTPPRPIGRMPASHESATGPTLTGR